MKQNPKDININWFHISVLLVILLYAGSLVIGYFMPLYTDEVEYFFLNHRAVKDNWQYITLFPQCGKEAFSHTVPWFSYIPALINNYTYGQIDNPIWVRILGIARFIVGLALLVNISIKIGKLKKEHWLLCTAVILAFIGLNTQPLLFIMDRPEQTLFIITGLLFSLALDVDRFRSAFSKIIVTLIVFVLVMCMHAAHPQSMALLPFEIFLGWNIFNQLWKKRALTLFGSAFIMLIGIASYINPNLPIFCPDSEGMRKVFLVLQLPISLIFESPLKFILLAFLNFSFAIVRDFNLHFHLLTTNFWIPISLGYIPMGFQYFLIILGVAIWVLYIEVFRICMVAFFCNLRQLVLRKPAILISPDYVSHLCQGVLVTLSIALLGFMSLKGTTPGFYIIELTLPILLLIFMCTLSLNKNFNFISISSHNKKLVVYLFLFFFVNQSFLFLRYMPLIVNPEQYKDALNGRLLMSAFDYKHEEEIIQSLAKECAIKNESSQKHLVLDDMTYFAMRNSYQPMHSGYFIEGNWGINPGDFFKIMKNMDSDGIITRCSTFPTELISYSKRKEGFCCVAKTEIYKHKY